jgi:hypothetical protein
MFRVFLEGKHRAEARHVFLSPFNALHQWSCSSMHKLGLHLTDCQRIPSYFLREMPSLLDPAVADEKPPPPSPPPPPPTANQRPIPHDSGSGTSLLALSHADPLTVGCCSLHAQARTCGAPPATRRTRRLRVWRGCLGCWL